MVSQSAGSTGRVKGGSSVDQSVNMRAEKMAEMWESMDDMSAGCWGLTAE